MGKLYDLKEATYRFFEKKRKEKIDEDKKKRCLWIYLF